MVYKIDINRLEEEGYSTAKFFDHEGQVAHYGASSKSRKRVLGLEYGGIYITWWDTPYWQDDARYQFMTIFAQAVCIHIGEDPANLQGIIDFLISRGKKEGVPEYKKKVRNEIKDIFGI